MIFANGTPVRINHHRDNRYTYGDVVSFSEETGNYTIEITGGTDVLGNPAKVGRIIYRNVFIVEAIPG